MRRGSSSVSTQCEIAKGSRGNPSHVDPIEREYSRIERNGRCDTVVGSGTAASDVLEVSNGITKSVMGLLKAGNDLVVDLGAGEALTLRNWYAGVRNVGTLQIVGDAGWVPGQAGTAAVLETLNLVTLAAEFDAARTADPLLTRWAIDPALRGQSAQLSARVGDEDFISFRPGYGRSMGSKLTLLNRSESPPGRPSAAAPPLSQRAPFAFADESAAPSQNADTGVTSMQPNLKSFLQFWNRPEPVEVPTSDWFADLLNPGADDSAASAEADSSTLAGLGLSGRSRTTEHDGAQPGTAQDTDDHSTLVICESPTEGDGGASAKVQIGAERPVALDGVWVARPPAARVLGAADGAIGDELARIQPAARSPLWWETWDSPLKAPIAVNVERLPAAIAPIDWQAVHEELAIQLGSPSDCAAGEQIPTSAWNSIVTPALPAEVGFPAVGDRDEVQVLAGRLRKAVG